jgi:hypothetical protein
VGQEVLGAVDLDELAAGLEHRDPVAELDGLVDVVGDEHDRLVQLLLEAEELVLQLGADDGVDRAERLVHQHDRRVGGEGPRDADALLLPARQLERVPLAHRGVEPDPLHQLQRPRPRLLLVPGEQVRDGGDVVEDGAVREEPGVLDHVADAAPQLGGLALADVLPVDQHAARRRFDHPVDGPQRGGLATAGRADEHGDAACGAFEAHVVERDGPPGIALGDALKGDQRITSSPASRMTPMIEFRLRTNRNQWVPSSQCPGMSGTPSTKAYLPVMQGK